MKRNGSGFETGEKKDLAPVKSLFAATDNYQANVGDNIKSEITLAKAD